jgi:hypothetical protein
MAAMGPGCVKMRGRSMTVEEWLKCSATWPTSADDDNPKLLNIAGGGAIICLPDGASLRGRDDRADPLGHANASRRP